jgi:hypothetical protein
MSPSYPDTCRLPKPAGAQFFAAVLAGQPTFHSLKGSIGSHRDSVEIKEPGSAKPEKSVDFETSFLVIKSFEAIFIEPVTSLTALSSMRIKSSRG